MRVAASQKSGSRMMSRQPAGTRSSGKGRRLALFLWLVVVLLAYSETVYCQEPESSYEGEVEKAVLLYSQHKDSEAAAALDRLVAAKPDRKEAFLWLGHARYRLKEWAAARTAFERYAALAPQDPEGPRGVARTHAMEGNKDLVGLWYRKALDRDPTNKGIKGELDALASAAPPQTVPTPSSPEPSPGASASAPTDEAQPVTGFWRRGVAGILGARSVWWGRLIAVVIFVFGMVSGVGQIASASRQMFGEGAPGCAFFSAFLSGPVGYILYWGVPSGGRWLWLVAYVLALGFLSAGAANANR